MLKLDSKKANGGESEASLGVGEGRNCDGNMGVNVLVGNIQEKQDQKVCGTRSIMWVY